MSHNSASSGDRVRLVLASSSPRRQEMLTFLGIPFEQCVSSIEERWSSRTEPHEVVRRLARQKAMACRKTGCLVIGMDTLVVRGNHKMGKPETPEQARRMLGLLSNGAHRVVGGVAIFYRNRCVMESEETRVFFRKISRREIDWYVASGEPFDKAGAYAIQGLGRVFIRKIDGDYYNVIGFPLEAFQRALRRFKLTIFDLMSAKLINRPDSKSLRSTK